MKLREIVESLNLRICCGQENLLDLEVKTAAASDLMSDVLARTHPADVLVTRLSNAQVVHTASIFGIKAAIIVRDRPISDTLVEAALEEEVLLLSTVDGLFDTCGKLYAAGMRSAG